MLSCNHDWLPSMLIKMAANLRQNSTELYHPTVSDETTETSSDLPRSTKGQVKKIRKGFKTLMLDSSFYHPEVRNWIMLVFFEYSICGDVFLFTAVPVSGWEEHTSTHILQHFVDAFLMASPFNWKMKYSLNKHVGSFTRLKALDNEFVERIWVC